MVAEYDLEIASRDEGVNIAVFGERGLIATIPRILLPALSFSVNVERVIVDGCTGSLKVAVMEDDKGTFVAPLDGNVLTTRGGVVSPVADVPPVVNDPATLGKGVSGFPATSFTPVIE